MATMEESRKKAERLVDVMSKLTTRFTPVLGSTASVKHEGVI